MAPRRPMVVLHRQKKINKPSTWHHQQRKLTKSSNNSASALNLLTNPLSPSDPFLPSATRGLNLLSSADSRNTMRGYAMGMPTCMTRCSTPEGRRLSRSKTRWYWPVLQTCSFLRSALKLISGSDTHDNFLEEDQRRRTGNPT